MSGSLSLFYAHNMTDKPPSILSIFYFLSQNTVDFTLLSSAFIIAEVSKVIFLIPRSKTDFLPP